MIIFLKLYARGDTTFNKITLFSSPPPPKKPPRAQKLK